MIEVCTEYSDNGCFYIPFNETKLEIKKVTRVELTKVYNWEIHDGIKKQKNEIVNFVRLFQFYGK